MLASLTDVTVSSPCGHAHVLRVTLLDKNTHELQGGANTSTPPGRMFMTWACAVSSVELDYREHIYYIDIHLRSSSCCENRHKSNSPHKVVVLGVQDLSSRKIYKAERSAWFIES